MFVGRDILIVRRRCDIVGETEAVEGVLKVHIQEALVSAVKRDPALGHRHHGIVITQVRRQSHHAGIEQVGPADVGGGGESMGEVEELVRGPVGDNVGVQIDDLAELGLFPQIDLSEGRVQVRAVH